MTFEEFVTEIDLLWEDDSEKGAVLLAQEYPEHYARYMVEFWGEDPEVEGG